MPSSTPWVCGRNRMAKAGKRALIVYQGTYPWEVRIEKFCRVLCDMGFECTLLCRWGNELLEREVREECTVIRLGFKQASYRSLPTSLNPLWRRAIRQYVDELKPDIIIAREMLIAEACGVVAKERRVPLLLDMAEHYPAAMRSWKKYRQSWYGRLLVHHLHLPEYVEGQAVRVSDAIVGVCEENIQRVCTTYNRSASDVHLVYNTPPLHSFDGVRIGPTKPARVFSYQGYITRERGVERCIHAFTKLAQQREDVEFLIAGDGESFADVEVAYHASTAAHQIRLWGPFKHEDLIEINSLTDVGLIVFDQDEFRQNTIPNKLFDYLMCAKPVIVSNCSPMARIVHENACGIVVDTNSPDQLVTSMERMCREDLSEMSANARKAAETRYHWEVDAQRLKDCIQSLL